MSTRRQSALRNAQKLNGFMARHWQEVQRHNLGPLVRNCLTQRGLYIPEEVVDRFGGPNSSRTTDLFSTVANAMIYRMWATRSRSVYTPDVGFVRDMTKATRDAEMAWSALRDLSVPNPAVVFPEPYEFTDPATDYPVHLLGFFTFGRNETKLISHTDDTDATRLGVSAVLELGGTLMLAQCAFPLQGSMPMEEDFYQSMLMFLEDDGEQARAALREKTALAAEIMRPVFACLLYLCCEERDEETLTSLPLVQGAANPRKVSGAASRPKMARLHTLGWRISDAMSQARRQRESDRERPAPEGASGRGGWTQPPHVRRMHVRRVRYGKGRAQVRHRLILPYQVGVNLEEGGFRVVR